MSLATRIGQEVKTKAPLASPALTGTPTINGVNVSGYTGFKNYIINGGFDVWQRGTSQSTLGYGSADRYFFGFGNSGIIGSVTKNEISKPNIDLFGGNTYRTSINVTTAPTNIMSLMEQRIENPYRLSSKTVTVSFYMLANTVSHTISINLFSQYTKVNTANFNTNIGTVTPDFAATRYSFTTTLPEFDNNAITGDDFLALRFLVPAGFTCSDLGITGIQIEEGSVATPFEQRPYGLELSLCQRYLPYRSKIGTAYFTHGQGLVQTKTRANILISQQVMSRVVPTAVSYSGNIVIVQDGVNYPVVGLYISNNASDEGKILILADVASGLTTGKPVFLRNSNDTTAYIEIQTEL